MLYNLIQNSPFVLIAVACTVMAVAVGIGGVIIGKKRPSAASLAGITAAALALASAILLGHFAPPT